MQWRIVVGVLVMALIAAITGCNGASSEKIVAGPPPSPSGETLKLDLGDGVALDLVLIPAGSFIMGSSKSGMGRWDINQRPVHRVQITKPFYLGKYEVTQDQYVAVMGQNPSKVMGGTHPVNRVGWPDAVAFCKKLGATLGRNVRLPTEAEWEYACRAGTKTRFYWGDNASAVGDYAVCITNSGEEIQAVGGKKPNAWGLYDMIGNVTEWCSDWFDTYVAQWNVDPQGPPLGTHRVVRGSCFCSMPKFCSCANRVGYTPGKGPTGVVYLGFRIAMDSN